MQEENPLIALFGVLMLSALFCLAFTYKGHELIYNFIQIIQ